MHTSSRTLRLLAAVAFCAASSHSISKPLSALPHATRIDGLADGDLLGISADRLGDFNGDGVDDFVVAAEEAQGGRGSAYVVYGRAGGLPRGFSLASLDSRAGFRIDGGVAEGFNSRARSAGDLNADGRGDLAIAHPSANAMAGRVCVLFGGRRMPAVSRVDALESGSAACFRAAREANVGREIAALGDVNGDGIDDLAIGAPFADHAGTDSGSVYVVFGRSDGFALDVDLDRLDGSDGWRIDGVEKGDTFGLVVAAAGDVDADGLRDVLIGAELAEQRAGAAYVVFGREYAPAVRSAAALIGSEGVRIVDRGPAYGRFARKVAGGGDLDGDGIDDVVVGAPHGSSRGSAYVVHGRAEGFPAVVDAASLRGIDGYRVDGRAAGDAAGDGVAIVGDVDRDGRIDLAVGSQRADVGGRDAGAVQLVSGSDVAGITLTGGAPDDYCGLEMRNISDVDADGRDELLVSCHVAAAGGRWRGSVFVVPGRTFDRRVFGSGFE